MVCLLRNGQTDRAVVGSVLVALVFDIGDGIDEVIRYDEIIDPSSDIVWSCTASIRPPAIDIFFFGVGVSSYIDISFIEERWYFFTFDREESDWVLVGFGASDVNGCVTDIEITTDDDFFALWAEEVKMLKEFIIEIKFIGKHFGAIGSGSAIGEVAIDENQITKSSLGDTSIFVKSTRFFEYWLGAIRLYAWVDGGTCISGSCTCMSYTMVVYECCFYFWWCLMEECFCFLEADDISIVLLNPV